MVISGSDHDIALARIAEVKFTDKLRKRYTIYIK